MTKARHVTVILMVLLGLSISISGANVIADEIAEVPEGSWGVEIEGIGKIAISCHKYRSKAFCKLFWIFAEIAVNTEINNGNLKIFTDKTGEEHLLITLKNGEPHNILQSNIITSDYYSHYSSLTFNSLRVAGLGYYDDIASFKRRGSDYNIYHERGTLKQLPASFPSWVMNPSAYLFKNEKVGAAKGLYRILEHASLSEDTLRVMYQFIRDNKDSPKSYLGIIARNPSTSKDVLESLFTQTEKSNYHYMSTLNAVASNPNSPPEYKTQYIDMIKTGGKKIQKLVISDRQASPEILDWIARNGDISLTRSSILMHQNIWPETLDYISDQPITEESLRWIAGNNNVSDETLLKLAMRDYKSKHEQELILDIITRHKDRTGEAINIALARLAESHDVARRKISARDNRISRVLLDQFIKSPAISVRQELARNEILSVEELLILARDDYAAVAREARQQLKSRFKSDYDEIAADLTPLSELNQAYSLMDELNQAVKSNDITYVKQVIQKQKTIRPPPYPVDMTHVFENNNKELAKFIFEISDPSFKYLVRKKEFNSDWLKYMLSIDALDKTSDYKVLSVCIKNKRTDYIEVLLDYGYDINAIDSASGRNLLYTAISMRDKGMVEYLLDKGIDTDVRYKRGQTPIAFARKIKFFDAVEMLDDAGLYKSEISRFRSQFTPNPDSRLIGKWTNLKDGFESAVFHFKKDGSGTILSSVSGSLVAWRDVDGASLVIIIPSIQDNLDKSKQLDMRYEIVDDKLVLWDKDNKKTGYYRVYDQSVAEYIKDVRYQRDLKYVGRWTYEEGKISIRINTDGTAVSDKNTFVWKNGDGNYITLLLTDGEKILVGESILLEHDDTNDVVVMKKGNRSAVLVRDK